MTSDHPVDRGVPGEQLRIRRAAQRAAYDRETIHAIVDAAIVAHVGTVDDGRPVVIPMLAVRDGDWLLLHGSPAAGTFRRGAGRPVCVEMTLLDGIVLARSAFHHSLNYRSVVIHGEAELILDADEQRRALELIVERLVPGRYEQLRPTTDAERRRTGLLRVSLAQASAKIRGGPPRDEAGDEATPVWAGVLPVALTLGQPQPDPQLAAGIELPEHVRRLADTVR